MEYKIISRRSLERNSHRPYAALRYMGYDAIPESVYAGAYIETRYGNRYPVSAVYTSYNRILILY